MDNRHHLESWGYYAQASTENMVRSVGHEVVDRVAEAAGKAAFTATVIATGAVAVSAIKIQNHIADIIPAPHDDLRPRKWSL